jgi:hypothetical protein
MSRTDIDDSQSARSPGLALAEQLRDGPLQELIDLQARAQALAVDIESNPGDHLREIGELVRLSLTAMEHFQRFTCDFRSLLRDLGDDAKPSH